MLSDRKRCDTAEDQDWKNVQKIVSFLVFMYKSSQQTNPLQRLKHSLSNDGIEEDFYMVIRVRRVGVFYFGTGWVGYLQKSSSTGTGRDG